MAVEFTSRGYDTTTLKPYTEGVWSNAHPEIGLSTYAVQLATDWKVTAVAGADRTVSISAGKGHGYGVTDSTETNDTIQLDSIVSGSRWDLIACRRDWTPTSGESKFVKVNGGSTAVIPGGRLTGRGAIDDQPLALVQVTAGQTQPTGFIDLRTWVGDGGGLIAAHDLVRSFLNKPGTRLWIDGVDWLRRIGANDTPEWVSTDTSSVLLSAPDAGWTVVGGLSRTRVSGGLTIVTMACRVTRAAAPAGGAFTLGNGFYPLLSGFIPSGWRPSAVMDMRGVLNDGGAAGRAEPIVRVGTDGTISQRIPSYGGTVTVESGWTFHLQGSWFI